MNLLEIYEENKKRKEEEKRQDEERAFNEEIREIECEIILGKEKHYSNNEKVLKTIDIKYKKNSNFVYYPIFAIEDRIKLRKYYFEYNKTNIKKIQNYIDNKE